MKKLMIGLMAVSSLAFGTGCGGDYCDDAADAFEGLADKVKDCPQLSASIGGLELTDEDIDECKNDLDKCSSDEKDKLEDSLDCINDMPKCEAGKETDWLTKLQVCADKTEGITCE